MLVSKELGKDKSLLLKPFDTAGNMFATSYDIKQKLDSRMQDVIGSRQN